MSIIHANHRTIKKAGLHTVTIPSEIIRAIGNADALAIWVYLLTMADDWVVRKSHLTEYFKLGKVRYAAAMKRLRDLKLIYSEKIRDENGHFGGEALFVVGIPEDMSAFRTGIAIYGDARSRGCPKTTPLSSDQELSSDQDKVKTTKKTEPTPAELAFDRLWQLWPNSKNKKASRSRFLNITKSWGMKRLLEFEKQLSDDIARRTQLQQLGFKAMMFSTYLNGERWNDDYSTNSNGSYDGFAAAVAMQRGKRLDA